MADMNEVIIDSIRVGLMSQQRVVLLRELDSERYLTIWIDPYMAEQITFALQEVEVARPMSHDLLKNIIRKLEGRILRVEIISLKDRVYYAAIVIENKKGETINVDSRPSDALALAVRVNVPILVSRSVMDQAGFFPEDGITEADIDDVINAREMGTVPEGAEERLSVFEDFLDNLDLGKGKENDRDDDEERG